MPSVPAISSPVFRRLSAEFQGRTVGFYVFEYENRTIWGATAGILVNLYRMLE